MSPARGLAWPLLTALIPWAGACGHEPHALPPLPPASTPLPVTTGSPAGPTPDSPPAAPALPPDDHRATALALGSESTCVLTAAREVYCWGDNEHGQVGDGTTVDRTRPVRVPLAGVEEIGAGTYHVCARLAGGTVSCWGMAMPGAGAPDGGERVLVPLTVPGLHDVERLTVGAASACARTSDAAVHCWGLFFRPHRGGLVQVPELRGAVRSSIDQTHGCFQWQEEGEVRCWSDSYGYHLVGSPSVLKTEGPVTVRGLPPVHGVTTGFVYACALTGDDHVLCWGSGPRRVFDEEQIQPVKLPGIVGVARLALGVDFLCALRRDGSVLCMGDNPDGELGDGTTHGSAEPRRVVGIDDAVDVAVGTSHACALTRGGALLCWGKNSKGQIGDGTRIDRHTAVEVRW